MKKEETISKIPVLEIFPPIPSFFKLFNTAEMLVMKLVFNLYSDPNNKFKKVFNGLTGQWVHTNMANSIGLTEGQFKSAIKTLSEPKGKNDSIVFIAKRELHSGKNGSARYIIPSPASFKTLIYWNCLNDFWKTRLEDALKLMLNKLSVDKADKLFMKEYQINKDYYSKINDKREVTKAEKELRQRINNRNIPKEKPMREPKTVSNEDDDEFEEETTGMEYSNIYSDPDWCVPEELQDER